MAVAASCMIRIFYFATDTMQYLGSGQKKIWKGKE